MKVRFSHSELLTNLLLVFVFVFLIGCSSSLSVQSPYNYNDGLVRSIPEEQGVPSETIARFFEAVEEKGYDVHGLMMLRHGKVIALVVAICTAISACNVFCYKNFHRYGSRFCNSGRFAEYRR